MSYDRSDYADYEPPDRDYDETPRRAKRYRCGGYASSSGHCGATDCDTCYPGGGQDEEENSPLARRLYASGYRDDGDGEWSKQLSVTTRVARRDHKDGKVKAGDQYQETVTRCVDGKGASRILRTKRILAAKGAVQLALPLPGDEIPF
jgi:hypothetical protein